MQLTLDSFAKGLRTLEVNGFLVTRRLGAFILKANVPLMTADAVAEFDASGHDFFHELCLYVMLLP